MSLQSCYESCQEVFKIERHRPTSGNTYFDDHLHFYVGNGNINFGVFKADKTPSTIDPTKKYLTKLGEITLRKTSLLQFGESKPSGADGKNYKMHIATQVLIESRNPNSKPSWPEYDPNIGHICQSIFHRNKAKLNSKTALKTGDFMCARPVLVYKDNAISKSTVMVLSDTFIERPGTREVFDFGDYDFIVCYGPYNQIILCAIEKSTDSLTDYIKAVEDFNRPTENLAIGINDLGIPSDYMETYIHLRHTLYEIAQPTNEFPNGEKIPLINIVSNTDENEC